MFSRRLVREGKEPLRLTRGEHREPLELPRVTRGGVRVPHDRLDPFMGVSCRPLRTTAGRFGRTRSHTLVGPSATGLGSGVGGRAAKRAGSCSASVCSSAGSSSSFKRVGFIFSIAISSSELSHCALCVGLTGHSVS